jgi:hypothetical protein
MPLFNIITLFGDATISVIATCIMNGNVNTHQLNIVNKLKQGA